MNNRFTYRILAALTSAALFAGCLSYDIVQTNVFSDDDGNIITVAYGRSEKFHHNTFPNPATGLETDFKSKLVIEVTLPDGKEFTAWQCMNFLDSGTMYRTDNDRWMVHVNGFSTTVYQQLEDDPTNYLEVYRGILCDSPKTDFKPNPKWRTLKKNAKGQWR